MRENATALCVNPNLFLSKHFGAPIFGDWARRMEGKTLHKSQDIPKNKWTYIEYFTLQLKKTLYVKLVTTKSSTITTQSTNILMDKHTRTLTHKRIPSRYQDSLISSSENTPTHLKGGWGEGFQSTWSLLPSRTCPCS